MILRYDNSGNARVFEYDYRNRLVAVREYTGSTITLGEFVTGTPTHTFLYTYDVDNLRIKKDVDGQITNFVYDRGHVALEVDNAGTVTNRYLHGPAVDQVLAEDRSTGVVWALTDQLGSVRDLIDSTGTVLDSRRYTAFGEPVAPITVSFLFGYTGAVFDAETGLGYHRARYLDHATGRWINQDPIGFAGDSSNQYRYVANAPTNGIDPVGQFKIWVHDAITRRAAEIVGLNKHVRHIYIPSEAPILVPFTTHDVLSRATLRVDLDHFYEPNWHAQSMGFVETLNGVTRQIVWPAPNHNPWALLRLMGQALHILQDFYSHTDWIDGKRLCPAYKVNGDADLLKYAGSHEPHESTLDLDALWNRNTGGLTSPKELFYFGGGENPLRNDDHNNYAADNRGFGRDEVLAGAFGRAYSMALQQSVKYLEWLKSHMWFGSSAWFFDPKYDDYEGPQ